MFQNFYVQYIPQTYCFVESKAHQLLIATESLDDIFFHNI